MSVRTIHPFPARMAPEIALDAIPARDKKKLTVLDPMCGSGTVLSVARTRGHRAVGIDIDPMAVMMSRVAMSPIDINELLKAGGRVIETSRGEAGMTPWGDDAETDAFAKYWFGRKQRRDLTALVSAIGAHTDGEIRTALEVAVSRIIITKSPEASLAADTSHSRPHRVIAESEYDVINGFERSLRQLAVKLERRPATGDAKIELGDARNLKTIKDSSIDMVVTSPPYLNALDYFRGHKLALIWFGYKISELRARRAISIGSERNLGSRASDAVSKMVDAIELGVTDKRLLKRGMIERFAEDCLLFADELFRVVKPGGCTVLVIGNSTLRSNYIRNDVIAETAMQYAGFAPTKRYEREIPPTKRYMAINSNDGSGISKRMRTEVVLTMEC